MRLLKLLTKISLLLLIPTLSFAQPAGKGFVAISEEDGSPVCFGWQMKFASGNVTDNGDGTCSIADQTGGAGVGGWTDNGTDINLTTSTDNVGIGGASLGKLSVDGDTDEIQLLIQGNAAQTSDIFVIEKSDGTDILTGAAGGIKVTGNAQVTQLASCDTIDTDSNGIMRCGNDGGGSGAPTTADYLVGTADAGLSSEIVVGTAPGGELGNTWASPTVDDGLTVADWVITGSLAVPQGTNPTVDAAGEVAVDTSATVGSGIRFYGDAAYTLPGYYSKSLVITGTTTASDSPFWRTPWAITIRAVHCLVVGGTNVIGQLDEYDANGANAVVVDSADITCTTTNANDDGTLSNPSIDAGDYLGWHTTSVSGTNTRTIITWEFTVDGVL